MVFTTAVMGTFSILRVIAETALYPWTYEFVPRRMRGQFSAISNIVFTVFGLGVVAWMGHFLSERADLHAYQVLVLLAASFGRPSRPRCGAADPLVLASVKTGSLTLIWCRAKRRRNTWRCSIRGRK